MLYIIIKILISAVIITAISEISKRSSLLGSILASVPLVSVLAIIWLYVETKSVEKISALSGSIFWLVIPSLSFFILLPVLLKHGWNFWLSLTLSLLVMVLFYYLMIYVLGKFGVEM
ncbi:MAG: DUF3147 family protein [Chloroflexota bacterium]